MRPLRGPRPRGYNAAAGPTQGPEHGPKRVTRRSRIAGTDCRAGRAGAAVLWILAAALACGLAALLVAPPLAPWGGREAAPARTAEPAAPGSTASVGPPSEPGIAPPSPAPSGSEAIRSAPPADVAPARIAGRVEDPGGRAAGGARVCLARPAGPRPAEGDGELEAPAGPDGLAGPGGPGGQLGWGTAAVAARGAPLREVVAAADGSFEVPELAPGRVVLHAAHEGWAESESEELLLAAGEEGVGLVLVLRPAARIVGLALDEQGRPDAGREVRVTGASACGLPAPRRALADAEGAFELTDLAPATYVLQRVLRPGEGVEGDDSPERRRSLLRLRTATSVALRAGEVVHVTLGGPPAPAVRLWGFVVGAEPAAGPLFVGVRPSAPAPGAQLPFAPVDELGGYELLLEESGEHTVHLEGRGGTLLEQRVLVGASASQRLDLELGTASIHGHVVEESGAPVAGAEVALLARAADGAGNGGDRGPTLARRTEADAAGAFAFLSLAPGTYAVQARAPRAGAPGGPAPATVEGLAVGPGTRQDDVEVRLPATGALEVLALGPGGPLADARVQLVDARGRPPEARPARATDAQGRTLVAGLPAGAWLARASAGELVSAWSGPFEVAAGATSRAEVRLGAGARLSVEVRGTEAPGAWLLVRDPRGLELARLWVEHADPDVARTVGPLPPLPPGPCTVRLEDPGGRGSEQEVVLGAEDAWVALDLARG